MKEHAQALQNIPVTVISGSLGSGKTTVIRNLVTQLPKDYNIVWLKNEYGDVNIDSDLAHESNIKTAEVLNGCLCCVLIGKLHDAIEEIKQKYHPDRLIIETAGTAHPFPIVHEINQSEGMYLDGLITVVDALNYKVFEDKSFLARKQSQYIDLIVVNKTGLVSKEELEEVMDDVWDLYPKTPKYQTKDGIVPQDIFIGIDSKSAHLEPVLASEHQHQDHSQSNHPDGVEVFSFIDAAKSFEIKEVVAYLETLPVNSFYRIKGIIKKDIGYCLLNSVLGRITLEDMRSYSGPTKITFMGKGIKLLKEDVTRRLTALILE